MFLKSTDDSMLNTLQTMSGVTHRTYTDSKTITRDMQAMLKMTQNEGKASYTMTTKEEPVIKYNDMAFISERNSIVFRAGDSPIWNRNETILPMSWRLFKTTITQPGKDYTLQTIPTLSTAMDFDVRKNQPNFSKMLEKRMEQAYLSIEAQESYRAAYGYTDYDIEQLDPDTYADEIMDIICSTLSPQELKDAIANEASENKSVVPDNDEYEEMFDYMFGNQSSKTVSKFTVEQDIYNEFDTITENKEQIDATNQAMMENQQRTVMRYAGKMVSRDMIISPTGVNHCLDAAIIRVYKDIRSKMEKDDEFFTVINGNLCGLDGKVYIKKVIYADEVAKELNTAAHDEETRVFADEDLNEADVKDMDSFRVTEAFLRFLITFPKAWPFADGEFENGMKLEMLGEANKE